MAGKTPGLLLDLCVPFLIRTSHTRQHLLPGRAVIDRPRREIGPAIEGPSVGSEEYIQRPAATAGDRLYGFHIDVIQIRPLFPVDLDVDKMLIHEPRGIGILKAFSFHDMAPVTGRITDADQD